MSNRHKDHVWGVQKYLIHKGIEDPTVQWELTKKFVFEQSLKKSPLGIGTVKLPELTMQAHCDFIQRDFTSFVAFVKRELNPSCKITSASIGSQCDLKPRKVCPDCHDMFWIYDDHGGKRGCPCHY